MSELPDRLRTAIGDEPVMRTVDIGGSDALVVTVAATHLYRSEGLLSDESVESFHHDVVGDLRGEGEAPLAVDGLEHDGVLPPARLDRQPLDVVVERLDALVG